MAEGPIAEALRGASDTREVVVGAGAVRSVGPVFGRCFGAAPAVVIADQNTFGAAGRAVEVSLAGVRVQLRGRFLFPGRPTLHADDRNLEVLVEALRRHDAIPVAVGSGSLNDLVKRASWMLGRRYLSVATAASVDGYAASGAAITTQGYKQTLPCPAPVAVIADLDVLAAAPPAMTASGYGDLLGKLTAGADWIVADELGVEPIDERVWSLVQGPLRQAIGQPARLAAGDASALARLVESLVLSGVAMQAYGSSRPASGAEHQFSHLWEMEALGEGREPPLGHGHKVGLGSIAIATLYERLLDCDLTRLDIAARVADYPSWEEMEATVRAAGLAAPLLEAAVGQVRAKQATPEALRRRLGRLREQWPWLRRRLAEQLLPAPRLASMLEAAGCPTRPAEIGLDLPQLRAAYGRSRLIRKRYTVLDLCFEIGLLDELVGKLFTGGGYWARGSQSHP